jgi:hypothetical protein
MAGHEVASSPPAVERLWEQSGGSGDAAVTALLDTIAGGKLADEVRVLHSRPESAAGATLHLCFSCMGQHSAPLELRSCAAVALLLRPQSLVPEWPPRARDACAGCCPGSCVFVVRQQTLTSTPPLSPTRLVPAAPAVYTRPRRVTTAPRPGIAEQVARRVACRGLCGLHFTVHNSKLTLPVLPWLHVTQRTRSCEP